MRGAGDLIGARQGGPPGFRLARLEIHGGLLARAREEARAALERNARLAGDENRALRLLLYLFERDEESGEADRGGVDTDPNAFRPRTTSSRMLAALAVQTKGLGWALCWRGQARAPTALVAPAGNGSRPELGRAPFHGRARPNSLNRENCREPPAFRPISAEPSRKPL